MVNPPRSFQTDSKKVNYSIRRFVSLR